MARKTKSKQQQQEEEASTSSSEHEVMVETSDDDDEQVESEGSSEEDEEVAEGESEQSSDHGNEEESSDEEPEPSNINISTDGNESCYFSLPDLVAFNTHQLNPTSIYSASTSTSSWYQSACIESSMQINEDILMNKAIGGTRQLLKELWKLNTERVEGGFVVAKLPGRSKADGYTLPRALVSVLVLFTNTIGNRNIFFLYRLLSFYHTKSI